MVHPSPCKHVSFPPEKEKGNLERHRIHSLHKKELSPHQIQRPRKFAFVSSVESFNLMSLGGHLVSTGAALVLTAAHWHRLNSADREPSTTKTCPTTSIPQCKWVKGTCVVHTTCEITSFCPPPEKEDEAQRLSSASWPVNSRAVEGEQAVGTAGDDTQLYQKLRRYGPCHKPQGQAFKDPFIKPFKDLFISPAIPTSLWVSVCSCSSCLSFSPSTLWGFFNITEGLELRPAPRFPYYKALSLFVLQKIPRNN